MGIRDSTCEFGQNTYLQLWLDQCPLWGYVYINTYACLNSFLPSFSVGPVPPSLCPQCLSSSTTCCCQWVGNLFGWVGPFLSRSSGTLHISVPGSCCYSVDDKTPLLPTLSITTAPPKALLFILTLSACTSSTLSMLNRSQKLINIDLVCISNAV